MSPTDVLRFSFRSLAGYRTRTILMVVAMSIGVGAVVVLTALGEGARRYVVNEVSSLGTNLLIVFPGRTETGGNLPGMMVGRSPRDLTIDDAMAVLRSRYVTRIAPLNIGSAYLSRGRLSREAPVIGSTRAFQDIRKLSVVDGSFLPEFDPAACVRRSRDFSPEIFDRKMREAVAAG